ncbi:hypothetical protein NQ317_017817 [Molorchus minor]|uniref:Sodium/nucleoside cotransporter n=1 Tax=Molorchus minor TaxID=1323400 RepID=A0ABQ9K1K2_9CUCU|nr:hypothetical protein NQ317_017817 [Molorchus minor]
MNSITEKDADNNQTGDHKIIEVENAPKKDENWLKENASSVANLSVLTVFTGYFAWATHYYIRNTGYGLSHFNATTCDGYGFLVILYALFLYGFLYSYVGKPIIVPLISKFLWGPTVNFLKHIRYGSIIFYVSLLIAAIAYLAYDTRGNRKRLIPISGLCIFLLVGYILSANKSKIHWRTVLWGIILQFLFGLLTIRWNVGRNVLECIGNKFNALMDYAFEGAAFTYGDDLIYNKGIFAFKALSTIYLISFLANILYYYGIMQKVVGIIGNFLHWIMGTSICESVNSAANIFLGQVEAPLLLAPYLKDLTDSEIHSILTTGFAMVSGKVLAYNTQQSKDICYWLVLADERSLGLPVALSNHTGSMCIHYWRLKRSVMAAYVSYGARAQDLITSSIMSAPAALCFSKLMVPETQEVKIHKRNIHAVEVPTTQQPSGRPKKILNRRHRCNTPLAWMAPIKAVLEYSSVLDAASKGAMDAFKIVAGVIASVISFLAFVYCFNGILSWLGQLVGFIDDGEVWTLELIVGKIFTPISFLMGVPWEECENVGKLIGIKTMVNEFVAFERMHEMLISKQLTERTKIIATYAICGFSNPGSIGIQVSALSTLIPNKQEAITRLVFRAFLGGALVCFMTACIAGTLMPDDAI